MLNGVNEAGTILESARAKSLSGATGMGESATGRPKPTEESFDSADWVVETTGAAAGLVVLSPALEMASHGPTKSTRHPAINPRIAYSLKRVARTCSETSVYFVRATQQ